jgi:hypothetical protein
MCLYNEMMEKGYNARAIAGNSGELIVQSGGDDTTCICVGTVAAKFVDYFSNFIINLHLILH